MLPVPEKENTEDVPSQGRWAVRFDMSEGHQLEMFRQWMHEHEPGKNWGVAADLGALALGCDPVLLCGPAPCLRLSPQSPALSPVRYTVPMESSSSSLVPTERAMGSSMPPQVWLWTPMGISSWLTGATAASRYSTALAPSCPTSTRLQSHCMARRAWH